MAPAGARGYGDELVSPWLLIVIAGVALLLVAEARDTIELKALSKLSASTGFLGLAYQAGAFETSYGRFVFAALVLSWIGDACLLSKREPVFLAGIGAFLLGHVGFTAAFVVRGVAWGWVFTALVPIAVLAFYIERWVGSHAEDSFKLPIKAYVIVISLMACLSYGCFGAGHTYLIPLGATMFFLSDISVARDRFVAEGFDNRLWGLPMYYGAQVVLAWSVGA